MQQTRVRPNAFAQANAVRSLGIGMTGLASVLSGAVLAALLVIIFLAAGMAGGVCKMFLATESGRHARPHPRAGP